MGQMRTKPGKDINVTSDAEWEIEKGRTYDQRWRPSWEMKVWVQCALRHDIRGSLVVTRLEVGDCGIGVGAPGGE